MMQAPRHVLASLSLAVAAVCCSCQQNVMPAAPARGGVGTRTYSDAVVHIGQVDPAYRTFFNDQNGANYSLSDQRKAYIAATQTARTPVRESDYRPGVARSKSKNAVAAKKKAGSKAVAAKGKGKKPAAKKRTAAVAKKPVRRH